MRRCSVCDSSFPYCSALYNVVVLAFTVSLPQDGPASPRGPIAVHWDFSTGLAAVLCKCIFPSQFPCRWTLENKSSSFSPLLPPLRLSVVASQLSSHRSVLPTCLSLCIAPPLLEEFRKQGTGVKPIFNMNFFLFFKVCAIAFKMRFFPFPHVAVLPANS